MKRLSIFFTLLSFLFLMACSNSGQNDADIDENEITTEVEEGASNDLAENDADNAVQADDPFGGDVLTDEEVEDIMTSKE